MTFHTLIASDIDGTLIPEEHTVVPEVVFERVKTAWERGYLFVAASGRQYPSLRALFAPVADKMAFVIENGGGIYFQDKLVYSNSFERSTAMDIARYVQAQPDCEFLADGEGDSYAIPKTQTFVHQLEDVQKLGVKYIRDFEEFPELVMKIAVWCPKGTAQYETPFRQAWGHCSRVAVSGATWIDFSVSDKGTGLRAACELFGIPQEKTIAFGDNWNDEAMLDFVACPYIMATANPVLRQKYDRVCASVPEELKKILEKN